METKLPLPSPQFPPWSVINQKAGDLESEQEGKFSYAWHSQAYTENPDKVIWESLYIADCALEAHIQEDMQ